MRPTILIGDDLHPPALGDKGLGACAPQFALSHRFVALGPIACDNLACPVIHLRVPGQLAYRELVTRTVAFACKHARIAKPDGRGEPLSEEFSHETVSAIGEAFNNVALHGYDGRAVGDVTLEIETLSDRMVVQLSDDGSSFDPAAVPDPDLAQLPESGMGLYIIRAFVDELSYTPGPPNSLRFTKLFR